MTLHNLSFVARLMDDLRAAIDGGRLAEVAAALRGGAAPGADRPLARADAPPEPGRRGVRPSGAIADA